jgi:hypothetical protein
VKLRWARRVAAGIPCLALLIFCAVGLQEWWLISTQQIAVVPMPRPGQTSLPEVPATRLVPLILGSGMLAAAFACAIVRDSARILIGAYAALLLVVAFAYLRNVS